MTLVTAPTQIGRVQCAVQLRAKILEAAVREFARHGYHGASTKAIARRARVSEMSLFRHFGSKQKLCHAALHFVLERQPAFPTEGPAWERIEGWMLAMVEHFLKYPADILFIDSVGLSGIAALKRIVIQQNQLIWKRLEAWILEAQSAGEIIAVNVASFTYSLFANVLAVKELGLKFPTCDCRASVRAVLAQMAAEIRH